MSQRLAVADSRISEVRLLRVVARLSDAVMASGGNIGRSIDATRPPTAVAAPDINSLVHKRRRSEARATLTLAARNQLHSRPFELTFQRRPAVLRLDQLWRWFRGRWNRHLELDPRLSLGQRGELVAARLLKSKGMKILEQGQRSTAGEIDIVALDGRTVVFVEVKTRATQDPLDPLEAVDLKKQRKLTSLALRYLKRHGLLEQRSRFDIVGINWPANQAPHIRHVENAFEPTDRGQMFS